jgi:hypothetical protein
MAQRLYASSDKQWDHYRVLIGDLFMEENMNLKDVAAFMEYNHNFRAT